MISSRTILSCALLGALSLNVGCSSFWYNLQPYRLQRLNRGPAPSLDPEFSSQDRENQTRIAQQEPPLSPARISANSPETVVVRAQSPSSDAEQE